MRCPKCGYISFDQQSSCGNCSNDLTAVTAQLKGTVSKAVAPFFLGAVLGQPKPADAGPGSALREEGEIVALEEIEAETAPAVEEEFDFAGAPLAEEDQEEQPLPPLGLEGIDFSDLVPPREEEEEPPLSLENTPEKARQPPVREEDSLMGLELPSLEPDDLLNLAEGESPSGGLEEKTTEAPAAAADEEIIDLSSLMGFEEPPAKTTAREEYQDIFELSLENEPEKSPESQEDSENASLSGTEPKKSANSAADIADLGLTLEKDDQ